MGSGPGVQNDAMIDPVATRAVPPAKDMVWIPGGTFRMGSDAFYAEERPVHTVSVDGFWMDDHQVTVAEFRRFVKATGYVTVAERAPDPDEYPGADPALLVPGSLVFQPTRGPVDLTDYRNWWAGCRVRTGGTPRARTAPRRPGPPPGRPCRLGGCQAYAAWAGKDAADRGGVGVRGPRRPRWRDLRLGRRVRARRAG